MTAPGPSLKEQMAGTRWIHDPAHRVQSMPFAFTVLRMLKDVRSRAGLPARKRSPASAGPCPRKGGPSSVSPCQVPPGHVAFALRRTTGVRSPQLWPKHRRRRALAGRATARSCRELSPAACRLLNVPAAFPTHRSRARELLPIKHRVPSLASAGRQRRSSSSGGAEIFGLVSDPGRRAWRGSRAIVTAILQRIILGRAHGRCRARP